MTVAQSRRLSPADLAWIDQRLWEMLQEEQKRFSAPTYAELLIRAAHDSVAERDCATVIVLVDQLLAEYRARQDRWGEGSALLVYRWLVHGTSGRRAA